jgi:putative ABC transport system ATP-binding protein
LVKPDDRLLPQPPRDVVARFSGIGSTAPPALRAQGLSCSFSGGGTAFTLRVDELVLPRGVRLAVVGPSGAGKTTLLGLLALALRPDRVTALTLDTVDAAAMWHRGDLDALTELRAQRIGFVPQTSRLLPFLTISENIALPLRILGRSDPGFIADLASALGIAGLLQRRPAEVSVGDRQRAAVARALVHRPPVLLADEPTASVHPAQADEILGLISRVGHELGTATLITTHDADRAGAAGFIIAPCRPDAAATTTQFGWTPTVAQPQAGPRAVARPLT